MLRTSGYTIFVDLPKDDGTLLVHGYTGAFDRVSREVAGFLRSRAGKSPKPNGHRPSDATVDVLRRRGYLTERTREEEEDLVGRFTSVLDERSRSFAPGFVLMPTYSCNLRCPYCFQDHMRTDPAARHLLRTMSRQIIDHIFAAVPEIEAQHGLPEEEERSRSMLLFGGEPLLAASRPAVEHILEKAHALGPTKLSAITNATELDAYEDLLGPDGIHWLQITLDGPPELHDQRRIYADGSPSFAKIAANIDLALERGVQINVRMNIDRTNAGRLPALAREIIARGWNEQDGFSAYVAPVHGTGSSKAVAETLMDSWVLNRTLAELTEKHPEVGVIGRMDTPLRNRLRQILENQQDPIPGFRVHFCSAQNTMYIFDAFGDIYACWEHTGDPEQRIGRLTESGEVVFVGGERERWRGRNVSTNPICRRCRYAFYCGGGCASQAEARNGEIHSSFCDGFARRFREAAALAWGDFAQGKERPTMSDPGCDR